MTQQKPQGILLCEVGNLTNPITSESKNRLEREIESAFEKAGAAKHGPPQIFWGNGGKGETMAAFQAEVKVEVLEPHTNMSDVDSWRRTDLNSSVLQSTVNTGC